MKESTKRDSMVFYESFFEAIEQLPAEEFKKCACAILKYGLKGEAPETSGIEKTIFVLVKPQIDKNNQRWCNAQKRHSSQGATQEETGVVYVKKHETASDETDASDDAVSLPKAEKSEDSCTALDAQDMDINPNDEKEPCGEYDNVLLSVRERGKLIANLGIAEYNKRLEFFSAYLKRKPEHKSACHYIDMSDWVGNAVAERLAKQKELPRKCDIDFEDIFERP